MYPKFSLLGASFYVTFLALAGTTLLTFGASISPVLVTSQSNYQLQNALLFENAVNLIASFMYTYFIQDVKDGSLTTSEMMNIRYLDWVLTTPLLLIVLVYYLDYLNRNKGVVAAQKINWPEVTKAILFNFAMLFFGYLGETNRINPLLGLAGGFLAFFGLFKTIYDSYVDNDDSRKLFAYFVVTWSLYGVFYTFKNETIKNFGYNILDLLAKVGFGLYTVTVVIDNSRGV